MRTQELLQTIQKALKEKRELTLEDTVDTVPTWDSLGHLSILVAIDKQSGGKAAGIKNLAKCQTTRAFAELLREHKLLD